MGRVGAFAVLIGVVAAASHVCAADLFPVQPLGVERDNLNEAYARAVEAQPDHKAQLATRRTAFLAFAAQVCKGPDVRREPCLGRLYNNQAAAFDIPMRTAGAYRIRPVQAFGRVGGKPYSLNLIELSRQDGKPDPQLVAFNQAIRAAALKLVIQRGDVDVFNDVNALVAAAGGGLVSARISTTRIGFQTGEETKASDSSCQISFPWLLSMRRRMALSDLFDDPDRALVELKPVIKAIAKAPEGRFTDADFADPTRWTFGETEVSFLQPTVDCYSDPDQEVKAPLSVVRPRLRKAGPVDFSALVDVRYD